MTTYNQKAKDGMNWIPILVVAVGANLLGVLIFTLTEGLRPGWVVYPVLLIIGLGLLRRRAITGALFLLEIISKVSLSQSAKPEHRTSEWKECQIIFGLLLVTNQKTATLE